MWRSLELRKYSLISQSSSQETVDTTNRVLSPTVNTNQLQLQCDEFAKSFSTEFDLAYINALIIKKNKL
jgi:hypothetical protein